MASFLVARSGEVPARPLGVPGPGAVKTNGYDGRGLLCSPPSPPHPEADPVQPDGRGARRRPHGSGCQTASVTEQPRNNGEPTDPETRVHPGRHTHPDGRPVLGTARAASECWCRFRRPRDLPPFVPLPAPWLRSGRSGPAPAAERPASSRACHGALPGIASWRRPPTLGGAQMSATTRRRPAGPPADSVRPGSGGVGRSTSAAAERVSDDPRWGSGDLLEQRRWIALHIWRRRR